MNRPNGASCSGTARAPGPSAGGRAAGPAQVAIALGTPDPQWLYDQLAPHAGELAIVGVGLDCGGAIDSLLAGLAWHLGRAGEAAERARAGLALETRVGSAIWIARTEELIDQILANAHRGPR